MNCGRNIALPVQRSHQSKVSSQLGISLTVTFPICLQINLTCEIINYDVKSEETYYKYSRSEEDIVKVVALDFETIVLPIFM